MLREDWRMIEGGLEDGLVTPQYGDYVPTSWKNDIFSPK